MKIQTGLIGIQVPFFFFFLMLMNSNRYLRSQEVEFFTKDNILKNPQKKH